MPNITALVLLLLCLLCPSKEYVTHSLLTPDSVAENQITFDQFALAFEAGLLPFERERIQKLPFEKPQAYHYYAPLNKRSLWMKLDLNNPVSHEQVYVLSVLNSYLLLGELYLVQGDGFTALPPFSSFAISDRQLFYNLPNWEFRLGPHQKVTLYLRLYDQIRRTRVLTRLQPKEKFNNERFVYLQLNTTYVVFMLIVCLVGAVMAIQAKQYYFLFYVLYLLIFMLEFFTMKGMFIPFFLEYFPFLRDNFRVLSNSLTGLLVTVFFLHFYYWMGAPGWLKKYFRGAALVFVILFCLSVVKIIFEWDLSLFYPFLWIIQGYMLTLIGIHFYLYQRKIVPLYLPLVFSLHYLSIIVQTLWNPVYIANPLYLWACRNMYFISLSIELSFWCYYLYQKIRAIAVENKTLLRQLEKLKNNFSSWSERQKYLRLQSRAVIKVSSISHIKSDNKYVEIYHEKGREIDRNSLKEMEQKLPRIYFTRIHKSYIVNLLHVRAVYGTKLLLNNGTYIPVSRKHKATLKLILENPLEAAVHTFE